jgi:hypothetical protein
MMASLPDILSLSSALVGAVAGLVQGRISLSRFQAAKAEVKRLTEESEKKALESSDLKTLGNYLYENIGPTRVGNYVNNEEVRQRVSRALESVLRFLGPEDIRVSEEDSAAVEQQAWQPEGTAAVEQARAEETSETGKALREILYGEPWNGLARIRRHIEKTLRQYFPADTSIRLVGSPRRMVRQLASQGIISPSSAKQLEYAIDVCNAGVHGQEVTGAQAQEAWEAAVRGLAALPEL